MVDYPDAGFLRDIPATKHGSFSCYVPTIGAGTTRRYPVLRAPFAIVVKRVSVCLHSALANLKTSNHAGGSNFIMKIRTTGGSTVASMKCYSGNMGNFAVCSNGVTITLAATDPVIAKDEVLFYESTQGTGGGVDPHKVVNIDYQIR